jgi:hypothetical protein
VKYLKKYLEEIFLINYLEELFGCTIQMNI